MRWMALPLLTLAIAAACFAATSQNPLSQSARHFRMTSVVMEPTLRQGETFLAQTGDFGPIERGSVYVVRKRNADYVMRVVGMPLDQFEVTGSGVFLKDKAAYYSDEVTAGAIGTCTKGLPLVRREHLPGGASHLIMACDYSFGEDQLPILIPAGYYFLMGDNRSNAADSRFDSTHLGLGLVPATDFVARAERILLSSDVRRIGKEID